MAIVANGDMLVAGMLPGVEVILHDMAISAAGWIVAQITGSLAVPEREGADAAEHPDHNSQDERRNANGWQVRTQSPTP